jgi:SH3-like domain-containing protein
MTGPRTLPSLLLALFLLLLNPLAQAREMVSVNRPELNMRSGAGTNHEVVWVLARGYPLQVVARQGNWLKVRDFENDEGWVYRPMTGRTPHMIVKSQVANIRSGPGTRNRIVGKAEYGEVLRTLENRGGWAKIRNEGGLTGWVSRSLLWGW